MPDAPAQVTPASANTDATLAARLAAKLDKTDPAELAALLSQASTLLVPAARYGIRKLERYIESTEAGKAHAAEIAIVVDALQVKKP